MEERGWPIPARLEPPRLLNGIETWIEEFIEIGNDRMPMPDGRLSPLPSGSIRAAAKRLVPEEDEDFFVRAMRALDKEFLAYQQELSDATNQTKG